MVALLRWAVAVALAAGMYFGVTALVRPLVADYVSNIRLALFLGVGLAAAGTGYAVAPWVVTGVQATGRWLETKVQKLPTQDILAGVAGLIVGLIIANLLAPSLSRLPWAGPYLPLAANLLFGYLGWSVATKKREEIPPLSGWLGRQSTRDRAQTRPEGARTGYKILDTSVIIDGRILDICQTGFLEGVLVVPDFVLEELRRIADSSDVLKRNRGRRGLDILNKMREQPRVEVQLWRAGRGDPGAEVDTRLVQLAQQLGASIVTNDFNLNKVASLQGIKVLNINELANAVKPVVLPGEEMVVQLIKDGKESGQGVGYLDDGTMIVVENGKRFIGQTVAVLVTSVLQTAAGRMIFARPKGLAKRVPSSGSPAAAERGEYQCLS
ncbi:MAG: PIN/TRAM domain-containing protein [Moorellales bacterium]